jgi:hypothetical protein
VLASFVRKGITAGRFRRVDPLLSARGFLGMVIYHSWVQELYGGKQIQDFDPERVSRTLADIWLQGMQPEGNPAPPERKMKVKMSRNGAGKHRVRQA